MLPASAAPALSSPPQFLLRRSCSCSFCCSGSFFLPLSYPCLPPLPALSIAPPSSLSFRSALRPLCLRHPRAFSPPPSHSALSTPQEPFGFCTARLLSCRASPALVLQTTRYLPTSLDLVILINKLLIRQQVPLHSIPGQISVLRLTNQYIAYPSCVAQDSRF